MEIRVSTESERTEIGYVHRQAFGEKKGPEIADLVMGLLDDETAVPMLSLVAAEDSRIIGHILYTKATVTASTKSASAQLLGPLAVLPDVQNQGVGGKLIHEGLNRLTASGVEIVFVLGHPDYYPRAGFQPAGVHGFEAPYPIPEIHAGAWMVQELRPGVIGKVTGKIQCCHVFDRPEHWRE